MNLTIFGSSITWGAWDREGGWAQRIKSLADNKAIESKSNSYTSVYCLGISGNNTQDLLARFDTEAKARLFEDEKNIILIEIGINDSQFVLSENKHRIPPEKYKDNLLELIEKSKQYGVNIIFVGLTPVDSRVDPVPWSPDKTYKLEYVKAYNQILKTLCSEKNIPFIEILSKFTEDQYHELLSDGLHPSTAGHKIMFEQVYKYLLEKDLI